MSTIELRTCRIDLTREQIVQEDHQIIRMTSREAALMRFLAQHPHQSLSRRRLLQEVWGYKESVVSRTVDTTIRRLRRKLEVDPKKPEHLITVHGLGYRFEPLPPQPDRADDTWLPAGCPPPAPARAALLTDAQHFAHQRGDGFVGLEHLLIMYPKTRPGGAVDATIRQICRSGQALINLTGLSPAQDAREPSWSGSPRLQRICGDLSPRASVEDFWSAVLTDTSHGLRAMDRGRSLEAPALSAPGTPARRLEVVGGPEDGRVFSLTTPGRIGRWWPERGLEYALYARSILEDAHLSRSGNLDWRGENTFFFRRAGTIFRWLQPDQRPGATLESPSQRLAALPISTGASGVVRPWDLICPTGVTMLQVLP